MAGARGAAVLAVPSGGWAAGAAARFLREIKIIIYIS